MECYETKDILHVKGLLGHKIVRNTMKYINLEKAISTEENHDFHVRVANNLDEACNPVEAGFDYICDMDGSKIFRRAKTVVRFSGKSPSVDRLIYSFQERSSGCRRRENVEDHRVWQDSFCPIF